MFVITLLLPDLYCVHTKCSCLSRVLPDYQTTVRFSRVQSKQQQQQPATKNNTAYIHTMDQQESNPSNGEGAARTEPPPPPPPPRHPLPQPHSRATLAATINGLLSKAKIPGCVLAVRDQRTRRVIWDHAYGVSDVAKDLPCDVHSTAFHLFSGTKLFTATAVMHLVQAGKLDVSASARDILAERQVPKDIETKYRSIVGNLEHVTVGQLLSHSSGLTDSPLSAVFGVKASPSPSAPRPDLSRVLARFNISSKPKPVVLSSKGIGRKAKYANVNYVLLAEVVSEVAGCGFEEYVYANVLKPMGSHAQFSCAAIGTTTNPTSSTLDTDGKEISNNSNNSNNNNNNINMNKNSARRVLARGYVNWWNKWALVAMLGVSNATKLFDDGVGETNNSSSSLSMNSSSSNNSNKKNNPWFASKVPLADFDLDASPIGGLVGTISDILPIFDQVDMRTTTAGHNSSILDRETKAAMLDLQSLGSCGVRSKAGMGFGWKHGVCGNGVKFFNHEGGGGGFTSEIRFYPDEALGIVLLCNKWSLTMYECVVAHNICEAVRSQVAMLRE